MTKLESAMTAGVFVEFHDPAGNTLGQSVFTDWQRRPLPEVGDEFCCTTISPISRKAKKLRGSVVARHFEVQQDQQSNEPSVWVRLSVVVTSGVSRRVDRPARVRRPHFSLN